MAARSDGDDRKEVIWSQPLTDESTFVSGTITLDLVEYILCRLPVKLLMQLRCVCKSWNSLISDPIFAKKHLSWSQTLSNRHHLISCPKDVIFVLWDSLLPSIFNSAASTSIPKTPLCFPLINQCGWYQVIGSCDGILCFSHGICYNNTYSIFVWNPSIRKFKILPHLENQPERMLDDQTSYGFGYDRLSDSYKAVAICSKKIEVHTLGTNTWKTVQGLPSAFPFGIGGYTRSKCGIYLSGTINWLGLFSSPFIRFVIFSFDLGNESYQQFWPPHKGVDENLMDLRALRDCLCILYTTKTLVIHVWLLEDYGNKDSWTKLFSVTYDELSADLNGTHPVFPLYILEDGQLLWDFAVKLAVYNSKNRTAKILEIESISDGCGFDNHVYIESLISP